ncbi:MAG: helix-turn-helix transcriptional regulator [Steroidobacteraceae bacterium]
MNGNGRCPIRARLLDSSVALVEDFQAAGSGAGRSSERFSPDFQVCLPYRGLFVWHVGRDDVAGDANQALFVSGGESFYLRNPVPGEFGELIITPDAGLLAELAGAGDSLGTHPLFRQRSRRLGAAAQALRTRFLCLARRGALDSLSGDLWIIGLLRAALSSGVEVHKLGRSTRRLVLRTKEFLEANMTAAIRLADVARHAGASPAYLTDAFRRAEGIPLHRYLVQLRLARALIELPDAADLTRLALASGFSSHSHFTAAFRRAFGCTPSQCRWSLSQSSPTISSRFPESGSPIRLRAPGRTRSTRVPRSM